MPQITHCSHRATTLYLLIAWSIGFCLFPGHVSAHYIEVQLTPRGFEPNVLKTYPGETVYFLNADSVAHRITSTSSAPCNTTSEEIDSCAPLLPGETFAVSFTRTGEWQIRSSEDPSKVITMQSASSSIQYSPGTLSSAGKFFAWAELRLYALFPTLGERRVKSIVFFGETSPDVRIEYWVRVFGSKKVFEQLVQQSGASNRGCFSSALSIGGIAARVDNAAFIHGPLSTSTCAAAFYYGAAGTVLGEVGSDAKASTAAKLCTELESEKQSICLRAVGIGLTIHHDFNLPKALQRCREFIPNTVSRKDCYEGIFLQNALTISGVDNRYSNSILATLTDPDAPCNSPLIKEMAMVQACKKYQPLVLLSKAGPDTWSTPSNLCEKKSLSDKHICLEGEKFARSILFP